jgi:hypothetical protein
MSTQRITEERRGAQSTEEHTGLECLQLSPACLLTVHMSVAARELVQVLAKGKFMKQGITIKDRACPVVALHARLVKSAHGRNSETVSVDEGGLPQLPDEGRA